MNASCGGCLAELRARQGRRRRRSGHMEAQVYFVASVYMYNFGDGVAQDEGRTFEHVCPGRRRGRVMLAASSTSGSWMRTAGGASSRTSGRPSGGPGRPSRGMLLRSTLSALPTRTEGQGVPQSYERAVEHWKLSEAQGNANATTIQGWCYANGEGVGQSAALPSTSASARGTPRPTIGSSPAGGTR